MVFQCIFDGFLMGFKFWVAAPGGFFENPAIFGSFGLQLLPLLLLLPLLKRVGFYMGSGRQSLYTLSC